MTLVKERLTSDPVRLALAASSVASAAFSSCTEVS